MSTMKSAIISDLDDNEIDTATVFSGTPKVWANLDGTGTIALRDSFNVASVVDGGTGIYTFNYTNSMSDTNYNSPLTDAQTSLGGGTTGLLIPAVLVGSVTHNVSYNSASPNTDVDYAWLSVLGDLA